MQKFRAVITCILPLLLLGCMGSGRVPVAYLRSMKPIKEAENKRTYEVEGTFEDVLQKTQADLDKEQNWFDGSEDSPDDFASGFRSRDWIVLVHGPSQKREGKEYVTVTIQEIDQ